MKKERSPILVFSCMLILLLFIILPPVLRKYIPNEENNNTNTSVIRDKLTILNCNRTFADELYNVISKTKYVNNYIDNNTITYQKLTETPTVENSNIPTNPITVANEAALFSSLTGVNIQVNEPYTIVTINKDLIDSNQGNQQIVNYFQDIDNQRNYYESMGYTCNILES